MTLDEAIKRYVDNAEYERTHGNLQGCLEFKQLVKWLKELRAYRKIYHKENVDNCLRAESEGEHMTIDEAIAHGKEQLEVFGGEHAEFIKLAIKALEKEPILDKVRAEIADLDDTDYDYEGYYKAVTDALQIIDKYKTEVESE